MGIIVFIVNYIESYFKEKKTLLIFLFFLFCFASFYAVNIGSKSLNLVLSFLKFGVLTLYYFLSTKKTNSSFVVIVALFFTTGMFLNYKSLTIYGFITILLSRIALIKLSLKTLDVKHITSFSFIAGSIILTSIGVLIFSLYLNNSTFFYLSLSAMILLIALIIIAFLNLLATTKKGNLAFFMAISLFVISDTIFGTQQLNHISSVFLIIASAFYNIAYFLLVQHQIEKQNSYS